MMRGLRSFSLAPDTCVRKQPIPFSDLGGRRWLCEFVPGLALFAAPVAGTLRMAFASFLVFDAIGALVQRGRDRPWLRAPRPTRSRRRPVPRPWHRRASAVGAAIVVFWVWRIVRKRRVIRALRGRRVTPQALRQRLEVGDPVRIVDLRTAIEYDVTRQIVPGAIRMDPEDLEMRHAEIPRDCDVVLY